MTKLSPNYLERLNSFLPRIIENLNSKGILKDYLTFGGHGEAPLRKPTVPTDARSEFLANRAMGDWAENVLKQALRSACPEWKIIQYGSTEQIAAGHPEFKQRYLNGLEETRLHGKRPDLLVVPNNVKAAEDISNLEHEARDAIAKQSIGAIEVRSSKFEALTYMRVRQQQKADGLKPGRETPSFTVKVEDLKIVYRWLERYQVPQIYCQVFFDSIFAINFIDIFSLIASGSGYIIEKPEKSQEKSTIMIPISNGQQIGRVIEMPKFSAEHKITKLGRHDVYVVPCGGSFEVEPAMIEKVLLA